MHGLGRKKLLVLLAVVPVQTGVLRHRKRMIFGEKDKRSSVFRIELQLSGRVRDHDGMRERMNPSHDHDASPLDWQTRCLPFCTSEAYPPSDIDDNILQGSKSDHNKSRTIAEQYILHIL